jgi:predicted AlkP superfamily phosphohydrolase/phosphomutase
MAVFAETHPAGHYFWGSHDSSSAPKISAKFSSTLLDVYKSVDNEVGKIAASLDGRTTLLLVSGHGMGPNHVGWHLLPAVFEQLGVSHSNGRDHPGQASESALLKRLRSSIPRKWRDLASRSLPDQIRDYLRVHWATTSIDWLNDRVFSLPTDAHGFVRVNLKGRESNGNVEPGREYEEICAEISRTLKDLFHPQTGKPVVDEVFLTDEVFPGPERHGLPDIIVSWRNGQAIDAVTSKDIPAVSGRLPDPRSGNHRGEGFALVYGPEVAKGQNSEGHLLDIAPTILSFYGAETPGSMDGRPWTHLFRQGSGREQAAK